MRGSHEGPDGCVQTAIPPERQQRDRLLAAVRRHVGARRLVPPLSLDALQQQAREVLNGAGTDGQFLPYVAVLVNNEVWRDELAGVEYGRRLLLLPQCLRDAENCPATADRFGMICLRCGRCVIHELEAEAEALGYVTLVAEGTVVVASLIESGKIEAVVGAGCLSSLEAIFPLMEAAALPGIAIPLLRDGCRNTALDVDWLRQAIHLIATGSTGRLDLAALRREVISWFEPDALEGVLGPVNGQTERIARDWLAKSGKRWRPLLAACAFQALREDTQATLPQQIRWIAVAVECFHKASLVHDDIEDGDALRYGDPTLHERHGLPVALNVGDFLLGEGYRLLAEADVPACTRAMMLQAAARAHRDLCKGQGAELCWAREPGPLDGQEVIDIYAGKTAPAFEVALKLGAILAGAKQELFGMFSRYCRALGVAYQIRDDLADGFGGDLRVLRPSLLLAIAHQRATGQDRAALESLWRQDSSTCGHELVQEVLTRLGARPAAEEVLKQYRSQAVACLQSVSSATLKRLLRLALAKIFDELNTQEVGIGLKAGHASGGL